MLTDIDKIHKVFSLYYNNDEDWPELEGKLEELRKAIEDAKEEGEEGEAYCRKVKDWVNSLPQPRCIGLQ